MPERCDVALNRRPKDLSMEVLWVVGKKRGNCNKGQGKSVERKEYWGGEWSIYTSILIKVEREALPTRSNVGF
jgi:hypothetical protein